MKKNRFLPMRRPYAVLLATLLSMNLAIIAADPEDLLNDNTDGNSGFYFQEINGAVLASLNAGDVFEPASSIKVVIHLHGMLQVENGSIPLNTMINWLADAGKFDGMGNYVCGGNDCYADNIVNQTDTYQESLRLMMECSDNALTQALRDLLGDGNIENTAYNVVGLNAIGTQLNHSIGCGADAVANHNRFNLLDIALLHEFVATSGILSPGNRQTFYDLMSNGRFFDFVIDEEAAIVGLTNDQIATYRSLVEVASKGGSYGLSDGSYRSIGGWLSLPFPCEGVDREYAFGAFIDAATTLDLQNTGNPLSLNTVMAEVFRNEIRASLESYLCGLPPVLDLPEALVIECPGPGGLPSNDPQVAAWLNQASAFDECGLQSFSHSALPELLPSSCGGSGTHVTFTAVDTCGIVTEESRVIMIVDTTPPVITPPPPLVIECNTLGGVSGDDPAIQAWYDSVVVEDACMNIPLQSHTAPAFFAANCAPGIPVEIIFTAVDACGNEAEASSTITVVDTTPPDLSCLVNTERLWPPNHKFIDVGLSIEANDLCDENPILTVSVTSDEASATAPGSGGSQFCPDAVIGEDLSVQLRAERSGPGDGRVYRITVTAVDSCGNESSCSVTVEVPHSVNGSAVDSGQFFDATQCE